MFGHFDPPRLWRLSAPGLLGMSLKPDLEENSLGTVNVFISVNTLTVTVLFFSSFQSLPFISSCMFLTLDAFTFLQSFLSIKSVSHSVSF